MQQNTISTGKKFPFLIAPPISKLFPTAVNSLGLPAIFWIHRCVSCILFLVQLVAGEHSQRATRMKIQTVDEMILLEGLHC